MLTYGLLGVIPFVAPPVLAILWPSLAAEAALFLAFYGALILSFLGGSRFGLAIAHPAPRPLTVTLAMLPTLAGLALLLMPAAARREQLLGLSAVLAVHWLWDRRASDLPAWYARLRSILTVGAIPGLVAGAALANR